MIQPSHTISRIAKTENWPKLNSLSVLVADLRLAGCSRRSLHLDSQVLSMMLSMAPSELFELRTRLNLNSETLRAA